MNLVTKISPKGIDDVVAEVQSHLNTYLPTWTNVTAYPRIYKEETNSGIKPMVYLSNGDYVDVFYDDTLDGSIFFYGEDTRPITDLTYSTVLSLVFQIDLDALYPTILHRADEEAHNQVIIALNKLHLYKVTNLVQGIRNVYNEFEVSQVLLDDINKFHVFRIDLEVYTSHEC
jgi:hypothetical protein